MRHFWERVFVWASVFLSFHSAQAATSQFISVKWDPGGVRLEVKPFPLAFEKKIERGESYELPRIDGYGTTLEEGKPQLPILGLLVGIPPDAEVRVTATPAQPLILSDKSIPPVPTRVSQGSDQEGYPVETLQLRKDPSVYSVNAFYPEPLAEVTGVTYLRHQRVARLEIRPVQYNPVTRELRQWESITVRVDFLSSKGGAPPSVGKAFLPDEFESVYRDLLINYEQAKPWRHEGVSEARTQVFTTPVDWYDPTKPYLKMFIDREGIYTVGYGVLDSLGLNPSSIDPRTLKVYNKGVEVPIIVTGESDGRFDPGDGIEFYGDWNRGKTQYFDLRDQYFDLYTDTNVYWLTWGGTPGLRLREKPTSAGLTAEQRFFWDTLHLEKDSLFYRVDARIDYRGGEEGWIWRYFFGGESMEQEIQLSDVVGAADSCTLRVRLYGTTLDRVSPDHHFVFRINGRRVGEIFFDNRQEVKPAFRFPGSYLLQGKNRLSIHSMGDTGAQLDQVYLDWIEITFPRSLQAVGNALKFSSLPDTTKRLVGFTVSNFNREGIEVFDLTHGEHLSIPQARHALHVRVESAGFLEKTSASIWLNHAPLQVGGRGIHVVVIDEGSGSVLAQQRFDTYDSPSESQRLSTLLNNLPAGRVVAMAIEDEGTTSLTEEARRAIEALGSRLIRQVGFRDSWAMVGVKGAAIGSVPEQWVPSGQGLARAEGTLFVQSDTGVLGFAFQDSANARYWVVAPDAKRRVQRLEIEKTSHWRSPQHGADYIVITHPRLQSSAQALADYRAQTGYRVALVDVQDIYDEFNAGLLDPAAIKEFLRYTYTQWQKPGPSYVVFFGDASWDYKGLLREGTKKNYVPSFGDPVSDNWYVCFDGDEDFIPEMFTGRIAVEDDDQGWVIVRKTMEYEASKSSLWKKRVLFLNGGINAFEQALFVQESGKLTTRFVTPKPFSGIAKQFNKTSTDPIDYSFRSAIQRAINDGYLWVNFMGHAGAAVWDIDAGDPNQLQNAGKYPFVAAMSCHTARFAEPSIDSYAEIFTRPEDRGAAAYWSTTGFGYILEDNQLLEKLFPTALQDTVRRLGKATAIARIALWQRFGATYTSVNSINQYTLIGDPAVTLAIPPKPDLTVRAEDITFAPASPSERDTVVAVKAKIYNFGLAAVDSVVLRFSAEDARGEQPIGPDRGLQPIGLVDSLEVQWSLQGRQGLQQVRVMVDPLNHIEEADEENNSAEQSIFIYSAQISLLKPPDAALIPTRTPTLVVNSPNVVDDSRFRYFFEVDSLPSYDSFYRLSSTFLTGEVFTGRWTVPRPLADGTYFWHARVHDGENFGPWVQSSLTIDSQRNESGWTQRVPTQFGANGLVNVEVRKTRGVGLRRNRFVFKVQSAGFNDGFFAFLMINGEIIGNSKRGHNLALLDAKTGAVMSTANFDTWASQEEANRMADYLRGFPEGTILLAAIMDEGSVSMTEAAHQALEAYGSRFTRRVGLRDSWAMIGRKGARMGSVPEEWKPSTGGVAEAEDSLEVYSLSGDVVSPPIGPAKRWGTFRWTPHLAKSGTNLTMDLLGYNRTTSRWDTLRTGLTQSAGEDLSFVDASRYPRLRVRAHLSSTDGKETPVLGDWTVVYEPGPDLAIGPKVVSVSADTMLEGQPVQVTVKVYNIGMGVADSVRVRYSLSQPEGGPPGQGRLPLGPDHLLGRIAPDSFRVDLLTVNTAGLATARGRQLFIQIDPDDHWAEFNEGNNAYATRIFVKRDTLPPEIRVTIDGQEPRPGDLVAAQPTIVAEIFDNSPLPIRDTTQVFVFRDGNRIPFRGNENVLEFIPESERPGSGNAGLRAKIIYRPTFPDGEHLVEFFARDGTQNTGYARLEFKVVTRFLLTDVLNYPNPFRDQTTFTYVLTQPAEEVTIKIYTAAGRLIRVLDGAPTAVGFNHVPWDGRDQDGDPLANGVYLYKVIARRGNQKADTVQKLVVMR